MTRKNDTSPGTGGEARDAWMAPRIRRLATSEAANNPSGVGPDAEGFS